MTRAKQRLFLLHSKRRRLYGKACESEPSLFLSAIQEELKEYEKSARTLKRKSRKQQPDLFPK